MENCVIHLASNPNALTIQHIFQPVTASDINRHIDPPPSFHPSELISIQQPSAPLSTAGQQPLVPHPSSPTTHPPLSPAPLQPIRNLHTGTRSAPLRAALALSLPRPPQPHRPRIHTALRQPRCLASTLPCLLTAAPTTPASLPGPSNQADAPARRRSRSLRSQSR